MADLPTAERKLARRATALVRTSPRPADPCCDWAHSGERHAWQETEVESLQAFVATVRPCNIFTLSGEGFVYFLPLLLAATFLKTKESGYLESLVPVINDRLDEAAGIDGERAELCIEIQDRISQILWTTDPALAAKFPGLAVLSDWESVESAPTFFLLRRLIAESVNP